MPVFLSIQIENCAIEDNNYSPLFSTYLYFSITERTTDYRIKDFVFTSSDNNLYKKLISFGKTQYLLSYDMVESNDISGKRYFLNGYGFFYVGLSSSKDNFNVFNTNRGPDFL